jgi:hypothetical protein
MDYFASSELTERVGRILTTYRKICAIHLDARRNTGTISHIPPGSHVLVAGDGFNEQTVRISWQDELYFVFREDVGIRTPTPTLN